MAVAGFRCPVGFKNYPSDLLVSTGILTPAATRLGSEDGSGPVLGADRRASMQDSETQRQECSEVSDHREAASILLADRLVRVADDIHDSIHSAAVAAEEDRLSPSDVGSLRVQLQQLEDVIPLAEAVAAENVKQEPSDGGATAE